MSKTNPSVPVHIGLILDGNRRWARANTLPTLEGHRQGYNNLKDIVKVAINKGVSCVSAFIFSTENWDRTKEEVDYLMSLALKMLQRDVKELHQEGIRVRWLGSQDRVSDKLRNAIVKAEELTKNNVRGTLAICFNYGGQTEIVDAAKKAIEAGLRPEDLNIDTFGGLMYVPDIPQIDILIRTSGEQRLSGFMLWRAAYAELYFIDKHWPEFNEVDLDEALNEYASRQRRFGT